MTRTLFIGNGSLTATGDRAGSLHEIYVPTIAPETQILRRPARIGIAVDGLLHWLPERFEARVGEVSTLPISDVSLVSDALELEIWIEAFVEADAPILARRVQITNRAERRRSLSLYFHHDLRLAEGRPLETARRDEESGGLLHASARRAALLQIDAPEGTGVPLVRAAARHEEGAAGVDAEALDGNAEPKAAAAGWVDAIGGAPLSLAAGGSAMVTASLSFGASPEEARAWSARFHREGVARSLSRTRARWSLWSSQGSRDFADLPEEVATIFARSLLVLRLHQAPGGGIVSGISPPGEDRDRGETRWCRVADGAVASDALGRAGYLAASRRFIEFAADAAEAAGRLAPVYETAGTPVPIPNEEAEAPLAAALLLIAAGRHFERERDVEFLARVWRRLLEPEAARLASLAERPLGLPVTLDWWGDRRGAHAPVAAAVRGALRVASRLAAYFGQGTDARAWTLSADRLATAIARRLRDRATGGFLRGLDPAPTGGWAVDSRPDASLLLIGLLDDFEPEDPRVRATVEAVKQRLWVRAGAGGLARYEGDRAGSDPASDIGESPCPHLATTMWLAMHEARAARRLQDLEPVRTFLFWAAVRGEAGSLPERLHPERGRPAGPVPSLAAHAWFVQAALDYAERARLLMRCERCGEPSPERRERRRPTRAAAPLASLPGIVADL